MMENPLNSKPRARSLNFLDKFKDKISRVDRHSGIIGALYAHPHTDNISQTQQCQNDPAQRRATSYKCYPHHDQFKRTVLAPLTAVGQQNLSIENISRHVQLHKQIIEQLKQARKIVLPEGQNQTKTSTALPPLIRTGYDHQKSIHRVKQMRKQRAHLHWPSEFRINETGHVQIPVIDKIR